MLGRWRHGRNKKEILGSHCLRERSKSGSRLNDPTESYFDEMYHGRNNNTVLDDADMSAGGIKNVTILFVQYQSVDE